MKEECTAFGDEVDEIMRIINREEPKLTALLQDGNQEVLSQELRTRNPPTANGDATFVKRQVNSTPHFNFERNKLNSVEEMDVFSPKTAKTARKTVAFNFMAETFN